VYLLFLKESIDLNKINQLKKQVFPFITIIFLCSFVFQGIAQGDFYIDRDIEENYKLIIDLKLDQAQRNIERLRSEHPNHLMLIHLENYVDFFRIFINEDLSEFKNLEKKKDDRLERIRQGNKNNPYYNLVQAEILMQWAIARLKFEEYYTALMETKKAHKLLIKNREEHPWFIPNNKGLAMIHGVIGTIPDNYKYLLKLFTGMDGTISESIAEINQLVEYGKNNKYIYQKEAYAIQALILLHLNNDKEGAWEVIKKAELDPTTSPLSVFMLANIAKYSGRTDKAIEYLEAKPGGPDYSDFYYLDFMLGVYKLNRLDPDADKFILKFTRNFKGRNYVKEAYQKLAWHSWVILENNEKAIYYYQKCLKNGNRLMDEDASAHEDALRNDLPVQNMLKSRLLFDGGYYERSLDFLNSYENHIDDTDALSYYYQKGRNLQMLGDFQEALLSYKKVLMTPKQPNAYQKCNAALQSGIIYETLGISVKAIDFYDLVLTMTPEKYERSLHQKAKAGLNRLKN